MTESKKELIKKLMFLNGSISTQQEFVENLIRTIRGTFPEIEDIPLSDVANDVINEIIPIYNDFFTEEELLELIKFFETKIGMSYIKNMNKITMESYKIGEKIGSIVTSKIRFHKNNM